VAPQRAWRALDAAPDSDRLLRFLDSFAAEPAVAAAKLRSFDLLDPAPGARVLDGGCGTGADALALLARVLPGGEVVGADSSAKAVAAALAKADGRAGVHFERAELAALPFADASFDCARADRTLLHVADPETAVAELVRVTRPGGRVVLTESHFTQPGDRPRRTPTDDRQVLAFLPLLLSRAGATAIGINEARSTLELGDELLDVLGAHAGPVDLRIVHVYGTVGP
jgi:SAM-dependent methyltransferase